MGVARDRAEFERAIEDIPSFQKGGVSPGDDIICVEPRETALGRQRCVARRQRGGWLYVTYVEREG